MKRIFKNPVVYFFILGFVVFGLHSFLNLGDGVETEDPLLVEVTSADIEWLRSSWEGRMQRMPTAEELNGLIESRIREEILSREAQAMGLDEQDLVIKRRLVQKLTFVFEDLAETIEPTDEALKEFVEENKERYLVPGMISFSHIYFDPERRGDVTGDAEIMLEGLRGGRLSGMEATELGDAIMLDSSYKEMTPRRVAGVFGPTFADAVFPLKPGEWGGPVASSFGLHLVIINDKSAPTMPDYETLRDRVRYDYMYEQKGQVIDEVYNTAKSRYTILVEGLPRD